jgi:hypothetical protein
MTAMKRRGIVWISPAEGAVPSGRMVDPDSSLFVASWQDTGPLEHTEITGAEAAIAWARKRSERVVIRLGHDGPDTYFSAGDREDDEFPRWPPPRRAASDWWSPSDTGNERSLSGRWSVQLGLKLQGDRRLGEASADGRRAHRGGWRRRRHYRCREANAREHPDHGDCRGRNTHRGRGKRPVDSRCGAFRGRKRPP